MENDARNLGKTISSIFGIARPEVGNDPNLDPALDRVATLIENYVKEFRADELDAVMLSVDKWFDDNDPRLKNSPATRAADAREIALQAIEKEREICTDEAVKYMRSLGPFKGDDLRDAIKKRPVFITSAIREAVARGREQAFK